MPVEILGKVWVGGSDVKNDGTVGMCLGIPADNVAPERLEFHPTGANGYDLMDVWINSAANGEGVRSNLDRTVRLIWH